MVNKKRVSDRRGNSIVHILLIFTMVLMSNATFAGDAVEAANNCVVIHDKGDAEGNTMMTCFENISLERTAFESGVCQWKTDEQAAANVETSTRFVSHCPTSYTGYCDRLVLGSEFVAPVKIFLYNKSEKVLARAKKQCLSGGGNWNTNSEG
jgi:hypothetical protein